jgi:hypothetical protein
MGHTDLRLASLASVGDCCLFSYLAYCSCSSNSLQADSIIYVVASLAPILASLDSILYYSFVAGGRGAGLSGSDQAKQLQ